MTYNTWFLPIKPLEISDSILKVQLPSQFFWEWIDEHFNTLITKTIHEVFGPDAKLAYVISEEKETFDISSSIKKELPSNSSTVIAAKLKPNSKLSLIPVISLTIS